MSLFSELRRRNVLRVGTAYIVAAWLLIQVAETIAPLFGFGDTPARIIVIALVIGLLPVLVFAWAFELTPEGLKKEKDVDRSRSITSQTGKTLDRIIMIVLAVGIGYFAFDKFVLSQTREASIAEQAREEGRTEALAGFYGDNSIAVLAFDDMSPDKDQEYMSDGIAEELLNLLAKVPDLRVISRSSAFSFKGKNIKLSEIADELNVDHILEGSVRKSGNEVRITAQLIEARSDSHLWSDTYHRTLDDIFAIQDEIAAMVVQQLKVKLLGDMPKVEKTDPEAQQLFLQARHVYRQGTADAFNQAESLFKEALQIQPGYATAWLWLAIVYENQLYNGLRPYDEAAELHKHAVAKAIANDPDNPKALAVLSGQAMHYDNDAAAAVRHLERALELAPTDPWVLGYSASMMVTLGRFDEAIALQEYIVAQDELNANSHEFLGEHYLFTGRWDEAIESYTTAMRLSPASRIGANFHIGISRLLMGDAGAALDLFEQETDNGYRVLGMALAQHDLGDHKRRNAQLQELERSMGELWPSGVARGYAYVNNADKAFDWLQRAIAIRHVGLRFHIRQPLFDPIVDDPRWTEVLGQLGMSPEQLEGIKFDVTLPN